MKLPWIFYIILIIYFRNWLLCTSAKNVFANLDVLSTLDFQWVQCTQARGEECLQRCNKEPPIHGNNWYNDSISGTGDVEPILCIPKHPCPWGSYEVALLWQILIIQFLGKFFKTVRLDWRLWLVSVAIGIVRYAAKNITTSWFCKVHQAFKCVMHHIVVWTYDPEMHLWALRSMTSNPLFPYYLQ